MTIRSWKAPLVLLLLAPGCDNLLTETPEDFLAPENFYSTAADARAAVLSAYVPLGERDAFASRMLIGTDAASDVGRVGPLEPSANIRPMGTMAWDANNQIVNQPWGAFYSTVSRANLAIDRIGDAPFDASQKAALVGEAKFLRALSYFYLVRLYGDVPLVVSSTQDGREIARTPTAEVYRQIVLDAEEAAATLPASWNGANGGRATRGAALTLLADAHLTRGEWQKAADRAKQVIDSGQYRLYDNYLHAFLPAYENGPEHVFSLQAEGPASPVGSAFPTVYFPREVGRGRGGGNGTIQPTEAHYASYIPGDYRRDATYRTQWEDISGKKYNLYPHVAKYWPSQVTAVNDGDVNMPIFRYAEVLLIHAEALNELGRPVEAVQALNQVRARARRAAGTARSQPADYAGPQSRDALREAIFQERSWEMAHEVKRWFDLVRRGQGYFMEQISKDPEAIALQPTDMLWPIPQTELDLNRALTQNPGY